MGNVAYADLFARDLPAPRARVDVPIRYNFTTGHNDPQGIPVEGLAKAAASALRREAHSLAIYNLGGSALGYIGLREVVAEKLRRHRGVECTPGDVLITPGSLQGIDFVNRLLVNPGDVVILEEFTYVAALTRLKAVGGEPIAAPLDAGGLDMDRLAALLTRLKADGKRAKYIYTIPTVQNPTGSILSLERRHRLIELSREHETPILEDECYADLIWANRGPPALYGMAPDRVIHVGSFSKSLAPALRIGYLVAPWQALGQMLAFKGDGTGAVDQMVIAEFFREHFESHTEKLAVRLKRKLDVLTEALDREFGAMVEVQAPEGGLFAWVKFPDSVDVRDLVQPAIKAGVAFNPGNEWAVNPADGIHHMRLCFGLASESELAEGIAELARVCFETTGLPERSRNTSNRA